MVPELRTFKFLTQKETMVTQISAASQSPNFHLGKSYIYIYVKNISVYVFRISVNFELEVVGVGILGTLLCFESSN